MAFQIKFIIFTSILFSTAHLSLAQSVSISPGVEQIQEAIKSQLLPPPEGFVWQLYKNAAFLKPRQWKEREMAGSTIGIPTTLYAASPEDFSATKPFEMGITLQIIRGSQRIRNFEAKKMVLVYLKPLFDAYKNENMLMFEQRTRGDFEQTFFRYRDAPQGLKPIIIHKFILANNVTDSVHIFTFESPAETWDENWTKYGVAILGNVNVLRDVPTN